MKCKHCGEDQLDGGENYCPTCGRKLFTVWAVIQNTAKVKQDGKRLAIEILIETKQRSRPRLALILQKCLSAATVAEHQVSQLSDGDVDVQCKQITSNQLTTRKA